MTDYDPDSYLGESSPAAAYDPDAYLAAPAAAASPTPVPASPPTASQHAAQALDVVKQHPFTTGIGLAENALSGITGGAGSLADAVTGADPGTHDWAYRPRWPAGQAIAGVAAQEAAAIGRGYDATAGTGPLAETVKERLPEALGAVGTVTGAAELPRGISGLRAPKPSLQDAQAILDRSAGSSPQSMGAAAAAPKMSAVSPGLQQAVVDTARKTGGAVNAETLNRHIEADSLPVKIQLTPGQASQEPALISSEMNNRARTPGLPDLLDRQNKALTQNVQAIRDTVGPDVFTTNDVEHGDTLIKAYKDKADVADADIDAKYKALRDGNGGQFPVDAEQLYGNAAGSLHQQLLFEHAPKELGQLENLAKKGSMTFEQFEALRTNLARTMRSSSDGNEVAAAGVIRQAMEDLPLAGDATHLKPLADAARSAARTQFAAVKADPAYEAAISGRVAPDQFVRRFVTGPTATRDGVAQMRAMIGDDDVARQTMAVAAVDHLRKSAGIDPMGNGNFTQAGFNKALTALDPKLQSLVDPKVAEQLSTVGNVARYTQAQPKGSFVNNSNTLVGALGEHAATAAENLVNAKTGIGGTLIRKVVEKRQAGKLAQKTMTPYGGLDRLSDVAKP